MTLRPLVAAAVLTSPLLLGAEADPARYPVSGEAVLPAGDLVRLQLDADWVARCPDPTTYALLGPDGRTVPFAWRTSDEAPPARTASLRWEPEDVPGVGWRYRILPPDPARPATALRIRDLPVGLVARVAVRGVDDGTRQETLVWNLPDTGAGTRLEIPLPARLAAGPWILEVLEVGGDTLWPRPGWLDFTAVLDDPAAVPEVRRDVVVGAPVPADADGSEFPVSLPGSRLPLRGLDLTVEDPLFSRNAEVLDPGDALRSVGGARLERVRKGGLSPAVTTLPLTASDTTDTLLLHVSDGRSDPLSITGASVALRGMVLLVPGATAGPHTVLACGPAGRSYDLQDLAERIASWEVARVQPGPPTANARWTVEAAAAGLAAPAAVLENPGHHLERPVQGEPGLVRLDLGPTELAAARDDRGDLRLVDGQGRQIPYLVQEAGGRLLEGMTETRVEDGSRTLVQVTLPIDNLPVERLLLRTERGSFRREVSLEVGQKPPRTLAVVAWEQGESGPGRLVLPVRQRLPREFTLAIENGDNAALPIGPIQAVIPAVSLRFVLPAGGARLLAGDPQLPTPRYDLAFLQDPLFQGTARVATLGEAVVRKPTPAQVDRKLLGLAVAGLGLALLVLIVRLVVGREGPRTTPT